MSVPVLSWLLIAQARRADRKTDCLTAVHTSQAQVRHVQPCSGRSSPMPVQQLRSQSPTDPTLRANPFPEVTDLFCRLPLPTLFYRLEAVHLGDLMRLWVRPGVKINRLPRIFKDRQERTGHRKKCGALPDHRTLSPANPIPGWSDLLKRKENSSRGSRRRLRVRLRYRTSIHVPGSGILTWFPFDRRCEQIAHIVKRSYPIS